MWKNADGVVRASCWAKREQRGSIMVLAALMMVVLIGFVGFAIDVGHEMEVYRETQNTADAAALAAAESLNLERGFSNTGSAVTCANASQANGFYAACTAATLMVQQNGCPGCTLQSLTYYDSSWNTINPSTGSASLVQYVQAQVSTSLRTYFLSVLKLKVSSVGTKAVAEVKSQGGCALAGICVLSATAHCALDVTGGAVMKLTNVGVVDNSGYQSVGTGSLCVDNNASIIDSGGTIYNVGGTNCNGTPCTNVTPQPVHGIHITDPLGQLAVPSTPTSYCGGVDVATGGGTKTGNCATTSSGSCPHTGGGSTGNSQSTTLYICPGIYSEIRVEANATLYLEPGIYFIFNGKGGQASGTGLDVAAQGNLISVNTSPDNGVMLYFTCGSTNGASNGSVTACTSTNNSAGVMSIAGGANVTLHGINVATGADATYNGMLVFFDRQDYASMNIEGTSGTTFTGTIYGANVSMTIGGSAATSFGGDSRVIVNTLKIDGGNSSGTGATFSMTASTANNIMLQPSLGGLVR